MLVLRVVSFIPLINFANRVHDRQVCCVHDNSKGDSTVQSEN